MSAMDTLRAMLTRSGQKAVLPKDSATAIWGQLPAKVGKGSVGLYRHWAEHSEFVRAAIVLRKAQVSQSEWDIVPYDPEKPFPKRQAAALKALFRVPNPREGDFRTFIEMVTEDLLVLDAGCIEEVRGLGESIVELWPVDGGEVKVNRYWDGDDDEARYYWYPDFQQRASWKNSEFVYMMMNPRTYTPVGLSPLETLKITIDAELGGMAYNKNQVEKAAPDGLLDLGEGVRPEQVEQFKGYWNAEVAGKGAMAFLGGSKNAKFVPFKGSNRDMQFLEWQTYLARKIAAVFQISPQDLGLTADVNRATAEVQSDNTEDRGLRPLLGLIQAALTREVVWDDAFGGPDNNLAFAFTRLNLKESLNRAEINKLALSGMPWKTIDEARREDGREPLGGMYAKLMANTPRGLVTLDDIPNAREVATQDSGNTLGDGSSSGPPKAPAAAKSESAVAQEV